MHRHCVPDVIEVKLDEFGALLVVSHNFLQQSLMVILVTIYRFDSRGGSTSVVGIFMRSLLLLLDKVYRLLSGL